MDHLAESSVFSFIYTYSEPINPNFGDQGSVGNLRTLNFKMLLPCKLVGKLHGSWMVKLSVPFRAFSEFMKLCGS